MTKILCKIITVCLFIIFDYSISLGKLINNGLKLLLETLLMMHFLYNRHLTVATL